jgi:REP element-mobilizing transposase RayT
MKKTPVQLEFPRHGGRRKGAGRKPGERVSHHPRPAFSRVTPALITLKTKPDVPSLRSSRRFAVIREAFIAARGENGMRVVEFSVLGEHLHLIVEADSSRCLSRGMQGLNSRIAKALNRLIQRSGSLFADHYHSRLLHSPTELVTAIRYVLTNTEHHFGDIGVDWCCSSAPDAEEVRAEPHGWLSAVGWRRGRWPRGGPPPGSRYGPPASMT